MDHKTSENGSEIKPDLKSNPDEPSVKTIQQLNLEKGNRTRVSKTLAYSLLGILLAILIIVVFVLPSMVDETRDKVATVEEDNTVTTQIDRSVLAQKPIAIPNSPSSLITRDTLYTPVCQNMPALWQVFLASPSPSSSGRKGWGPPGIRKDEPG